MCQEVFQMVQSMDIKSVELQLALQCAPLITNIKISNLLIIPRGSERILHMVLRDMEISSFRLFQNDEKTTYLLFRRESLEVYLGKKEVRSLFIRFGYQDLSLGAILHTFQHRYRAYMEQEQRKTERNKEFPHEMGLLLGYPVSDVEGFIQNDGENFLYSGYWKVYDDVDSKKRLFQKYEEAKELLILLLADKIEMRLILEMYREDTDVGVARRYA